MSNPDAAFLCISVNILLMSLNTKPPIPLAEFQQEMEDLTRWAKHGCSDGGCQIEPPTGQHTNGGCHCTPRRFAEHLIALAIKLDEHGRYGRWKTSKQQTT